MLVLTRKTGETITIDGDIVVQVINVKGKQVRIGIEAPKNKKVQRGELMNKFDNFASKENFNIKENSQQNFNTKENSQPNSL